MQSLEGERGGHFGSCGSKGFKIIIFKFFDCRPNFLGPIENKSQKLELFPKPSQYSSKYPHLGSFFLPKIPITPPNPLKSIEHQREKTFKYTFLAA